MTNIDPLSGLVFAPGGFSSGNILSAPTYASNAVATASTIGKWYSRMQGGRPSRCGQHKRILDKSHRDYLYTDSDFATVTVDRPISCPSNVFPTFFWFSIFFLFIYIFFSSFVSPPSVKWNRKAAITKLRTRQLRIPVYRLW